VTVRVIRAAGKGIPHNAALHGVGQVLGDYRVRRLRNPSRPNTVHLNQMGGVRSFSADSLKAVAQGGVRHCITTEWTALSFATHPRQARVSLEFFKPPLDGAGTMFEFEG
jgi:hypothetical protein